MKRFQSNLLKAKTDSLKRDNIKEDEDSGWLTHRLVFALDKSKVKWCENKGLLLVGCFEFSQVAPQGGIHPDFCYTCFYPQIGR